MTISNACKLFGSPPRLSPSKKKKKEKKKKRRKKKPFDSSWFSSEGTLISASTVPYLGYDLQELDFDGFRISWPSLRDCIIGVAELSVESRRIDLRLVLYVRV